MLTTILIIIALAIGGLLFMASRQPDEFRYSRSATMNAAPFAIFNQVNDLQKWNAWSPWAKLDPNAKSEFSGAVAGVGSKLAWDGNNKIGAGSMTITESIPDERVTLQLDFMRPFKGTQMAEFTFEAQGDQTLVTWSTFGKVPFMGKLMGMLMNCEKMIGDNYEQGLASIKKIVEQ